MNQHLIITALERCNYTPTIYNMEKLSKLSKLFSGALKGIREAQQEDAADRKRRANIEKQKQNIKLQKQADVQAVEKEYDEELEKLEEAGKDDQVCILFPNYAMFILYT